MPINKFVKKLIKKRKKASKQTAELPIVDKHSYQILTDNIPQNAINSLKRFHRSKFQAYLVGGSVRDLLLRVAPKDIDIATDAKPEEIYKLFKNCRLIGKRFRLAHLLFNRSIIEVATFRGTGEQANQNHKTNMHGLVIRDNIYGNIEEDAWRRDFTINALYYDAIKNDLIDFTGGLCDLKDKTLRIIGDPDARYREDPVRMLRAIRFAAKLDFSIEERTSKAIYTNNNLIKHVSPSRLFDEIIKLFHSGHAEKTYILLNSYGFISILFSQTYELLQTKPEIERSILYTLQNTDKRIADNKPVTPAFLFVALLWPVLQDEIKKLNKEKMHTAKKMEISSREILHNQNQTTAVSKRYIRAIKEIWNLQTRLMKRRGKSPLNIINHPRFRAAFDFLSIRAQAGEIEQSIADWWTAFQFASPEKQQDMLTELHERKK